MRKSGSRRQHAAARTRGRRGGETAKHRHTGIMKPVRPDEVLAGVIGAQPRTRGELTRDLWKYIKSHGLQDPDDGRVIHPDRALKRVLGDKRELSMFEISRGLNAHLRK